MKTIYLKEFGTILTGREKGKETFVKIAQQITSEIEVVFDLSGVLSMGSSFGDEVLPKIALRQGGKVVVRKANPSVRQCLNLIAKDAGIELNFE